MGLLRLTVYVPVRIQKDIVTAQAEARTTKVRLEPNKGLTIDEIKTRSPQTSNQRLTRKTRQNTLLGTKESVFLHRWNLLKILITNPAVTQPRRHHAHAGPRWNKDWTFMGFGRLITGRSPNAFVCTRAIGRFACNCGQQVREQMEVQIGSDEIGV
ncbi:hypothetical protein pipiens_009676 [Culex pipiens pipiens]|uniref:Uncharacterized protein n=1 Tax=Culex pipiens pipiens TaxID=38569 RepID=A0ABD1DDM3_CULPP